jgi:hypothetical protein
MVKSYFICFKDLNYAKAIHYAVDSTSDNEYKKAKN